MDKYSKKYMESHCIDVFFICGQYPIHILTSGSTIPDALNDILRNRTLQEELEGADAILEQVTVSTNDPYIQSVIDRHRSVLKELGLEYDDVDTAFLNPNVEQIASHFCFYARRGFYSYDCCEVMENGTAKYKLMAWPDNPQQLKYELTKFQPKFGTLFHNQPVPDEIVM